MPGPISMIGLKASHVALQKVILEELIAIKTELNPTLDKDAYLGDLLKRIEQETERIQNEYTPQR